MEPSDPAKRKTDDPPDAPTLDALRGLEQRLERASQAAEQLISEALRAAAPGEKHAAGETDDAAGAAKPPPRGWQQTGSTGTAGSELDVLGQVVRSLRDLIPPELQERLAAALREVLLALRALIDWYLERIEKREREPAEVEDIPIT